MKGAARFRLGVLGRAPGLEPGLGVLPLCFIRINRVTLFKSQTNIIQTFEQAFLAKRDDFKLNGHTI